MKTNFWTLLILGGLSRYYLSTTKLANVISERVEFATPLNTYRRILEGIALIRHKIDPYSGDIVHESPILLRLFAILLEHAPGLVPLVYILVDLLTAALLFSLSKCFVLQKLREQKINAKMYAEGTKDLQYQPYDKTKIPLLVLLVYLFNPLSILNCIGLTTTIFSNFVLALLLYCMVQRHLVPCLVLLAFESMRSLYPVVLLAPIILIFSRRTFAYGALIILAFATCCAAVAGINYQLTHSWSFLDGTLGFIFFYRELRPNIGLFWYFFTEMFDHFRTMFLITFQMNATVLYLVPLSLKLRKEPLLLATVLIALMTVFRAYPSLGDVSFYLAIMPIWRRCWKYMAHTFVVFTFFLLTFGMMGALWHLWINEGSANANFYFGATLAFSTGQIFLITDLLFAHLKRDFCLRNGQKVMVDGKDAKLILQ